MYTVHPPNEPNIRPLSTPVSLGYKHNTMRNNNEVQEDETCLFS